MYPWTNLLAIAPSLFLCLLTAPSTHAHSLQLNQPPAQVPQYLLRPQDSRPLLTRWRDRVVRTFWGIPHHGCDLKAPKHQFTSKTSPPPSLLSRYGGDMVLRFNISSPEEAEALAEAIDVLILDVWEFTRDWVDIRLSKDVVPSLLGLLPPSLQHSHTPLMHDLAQAIYESYPSLAFQDTPPPLQDTHRTFSPSLRPSPPSETNIFFRSYQPLSVIIPWMRLLHSLFPSHVRMINIGYTYEGRDIPALRIGAHPTNSEKPSEPRKTILIVGGSHAREWISTSTVNYIAYSLITGYGKSKQMTELLEQFDFVFLPVLNVDGYVYTWENDRLWRKNRQQTSLRFCKGLDLEHSWGFQWDASTSNSNPCSEGFSGDEPFEAVEARRLASWVRNETEHNNVSFVSFLDLHSYSQQVLYPYSYSCTDTPPSLENLQELAIGLAKAIRLTNGEIYGVTSACEGSVTAANETPKNQRLIWPRVETGGGSALDWFYHEAHVPYSYQIKLRDTGSYGFLLPADNIVPTGEEALAAVKYLGKWLLGNRGIEKEEGEKELFGEWQERRSEGPKGSMARLYQAVEQASKEHEKEMETSDDEQIQWELKRRRR